MVRPVGPAPTIATGIVEGRGDSLCVVVGVSEERGESWVV